MSLLIFIFVCFLFCIIYKIIASSISITKANSFSNLYSQDDINEPFCMEVQDVFEVSNRGVVFTGIVKAGIIKIGDKIKLVSNSGNRDAAVTGIEMFRKQIDQARAGDHVGIFTKDINIIDAKFIQIITQPD